MEESVKIQYFLQIKSSRSHDLRGNVSLLTLRVNPATCEAYYASHSLSFLSRNPPVRLADRQTRDKFQQESRTVTFLKSSECIVRELHSRVSPLKTLRR